MLVQFLQTRLYLGCRLPGPSIVGFSPIWDYWVSTTNHTGKIMKHAVVVTDRTKTTGSTIVEHCSCGPYLGCAISTYKALVTEYAAEIDACTHHVELICNNDGAG